MYPCKSHTIWGTLHADSHTPGHLLRGSELRHSFFIVLHLSAFIIRVSSVLIRGYFPSASFLIFVLFVFSLRDLRASA